MLKHVGYLLCLAGAAFAGFPPPRLFEREESPEEMVVRILEEEPAPPEDDGILAEAGMRVRVPGDRAPRRPHLLGREPRPPRAAKVRGRFGRG